jgi:4-amino-4-deoxychorismate lyase
LTRLLPIDRDCQELARPATLTVAQTRWPTQPLLAGIKHLNRLEQVLAAAEAKRAGVDDVVMLDQGGQLVSVSSGNLFLVHGDTLSTPPLEQCGIAGTRRRLVMTHWAAALGLGAAERQLELDDLRSADEAFYCNSLTGMRPVGRFDTRHWTSHPVCTALHARCQAIQSC